MISAFRISMILLMLIPFRPAESTTGPEQELLARIQTARALEDAGEWNRAMSIYELLNRRMPDHPLVLECYFECCLKMHRYDDAFAAVEKRISNHPEDFRASCMRSRLLVLSGRKTEALGAWNLLLAAHPKDEDVYRSVAESMNQAQLQSEAAGVYEKGRKSIGRPDAFALELSSLYENRSEYGKAAGELMVYFRSHADQGDHVQSRLSRFPREKSVSNELFNIMRKMPEIQSGNGWFYGLFVKYAIASGNFSDAFKVTGEIESRAETKNKGFALLQLATEAGVSGDYSESEKTYREVLSRYPDFSRKVELYIGLAKCCRSQHNLEEALHFFDKAIGSNPDPGFLKEALLNKAQVCMNDLGDYRGAIQSLKILIDKFPRSPEQMGWVVEMGKGHLALGNLISAESAFRAALETEKSSPDVNWIPPLAMLSRTYFYQNKLDESLKLLNRLSVNNLNSALYQDPLLNDALELKIFIEEYRYRCPDGVRLFAEADFFQIQNRLKDAISVLDSIPDRCSENGIQAESLLKKAEIYRKMGQFSECRSWASVFLKKYPDHLKASEAMGLIARTYDQTGHDAEAIIQYDRIIREFPNTLAAEESRNRIHVLRENANP
jgi:tetratricopeptide (TPR) repeat protein